MAWTQRVQHVIDAEDGGPDTDYPDGKPQLVGVCKPCHVRVKTPMTTLESAAHLC
ncbi:hypothetical protein MSHI_33620 [Mycobacterium shinjukuense]|uniref:Uncharacterized protein n=1 Tax=Mycobacterium shinjukuense TaxID=398694 RepID=A0A7I7MTN4_9MYCO|nr:hypothetical protein MSHI_33620 [Mycobacterium shinjukuense]